MKKVLNFDNCENVYLDELIRENARLTVQHEADRQHIEKLTERLEMVESEAAAQADAVAARAEAKAQQQSAEAMLAKAVADLHFVMAGGDPCKVCAVKCLMGEGNCKPVWRGEEDVQ